MKTFKLAPIVLALLLCSASAARVSAQTSEDGTHLIQIGQPDRIYSEVLDGERHLWIHLPNGGHLMPGQTYPVIYLLDAETHLGGLAMIQEYYNFFRLPEMIVVGIASQDHRTLNFTPSVVENRNGAAVEESGGSETFTQFMATELIPFIDSKYPTNEHRTLIGHSFAGLFAINTLIHHPDLFRNYVAIDPSLGWDNKAWLDESLPTILASKMVQKGLFVAISNEIIRFSDELTVETVSADTTEFSLEIRSSLEFVRRMKQDTPPGLRFDWAFYETDIHGSVPLLGMRDGLVFLYDFWELKKPSVFNNPETPASVLADLIRSQMAAATEGMGYPAGMDWELLDMLGNMSMDFGDLEKARAMFEISAEYYPDNVATHESLMNVCKQLNDTECALREAKKADELSGGTEYTRSLNQ